MTYIFIYQVFQRGMTSVAQFSHLRLMTSEALNVIRTLLLKHTLRPTQNGRFFADDIFAANTYQQSY